MANLTPNSVLRLHGLEKNLQPIVQIIRLVPTGTAENPHRLMISDSVSQIEVLLLPKFNDQIERNQIVAGCVVQLMDYVFDKIADRMFMFVTEMQILALHCNIIGEPTTVLKFGDPPPQHGPAHQLAPFQDFTPLSDLCPGSSEWIIKGRVTAKGILRDFKINMGPMHAFCFDFLDCSGNEIIVNCISRLGKTDYEYYKNIKVGSVYQISNGKIVTAPTDAHLKNPCRIILDETSMVENCEDDEAIPKKKFSFTPINMIKNMEDHSVVDIIGVVKAIEPTEYITCNDGSNVVKRVLTIFDITGEAKITLWGPRLCYGIGEQLDNSLDSDDKYDFLAVKGGRFIDSLTALLETISATQLILDPKLPEANALRRNLKIDDLVYGDDARMLKSLRILAPTSIADVDWDNVLKDRTGTACQKRWRKLAKHLHSTSSGSRDLPFIEQVEKIWVTSRPYYSDEFRN